MTNPRKPTPEGETATVSVRLTRGTLEAVDAAARRLGLRNRAETLRVLAMRGFEDFVARKRRIVRDRDERPYPLHVAVELTEAEAEAIAGLARLLQGGSVNQPLVTALNKVRRDLDFARDYYGSHVNARPIPFPDVGEEPDGPQKGMSP